MKGELHAPSLRHHQEEPSIISHTTGLCLLADHTWNAAHTPQATISPPNVAQDSIKNKVPDAHDGAVRNIPSPLTHARH